jgi:hypothetical protein
MRSMQCNVEFGYQLSIRSGTKENHGKPRYPLLRWLGKHQSRSRRCGKENNSLPLPSLPLYRLPLLLKARV